MTNYDIDKIPETIDGIEVIQDISIAVEALQNGEIIARYEFGDSMQPILKSGQFCRIVPMRKGYTVKQGDAVFACVNGFFGTHLVWMIVETNGKKWYCIATTQGNIIGWTDEILGIAHGIPHVVKENEKEMKKKWRGVSSFAIGDSFLRTSINPSPMSGYSTSSISRSENISDEQLEEMLGTNYEELEDGDDGIVMNGGPF